MITDTEAINLRFLKQQASTKLETDSVLKTTKEKWLDKIQKRWCGRMQELGTIQCVKKNQQTKDEITYTGEIPNMNNFLNFWS